MPVPAQGTRGAARSWGSAPRWHTLGVQYVSAATVVRAAGSRPQQLRSRRAGATARLPYVQLQLTRGKLSRRRMRTRGARAAAGAGVRAAPAPPADGAPAQTAAPIPNRARAATTAPRCLRARRAPASLGWRAPAGGSRAQTSRPGPSSSAPLGPPAPRPAGPMCAASRPARPTAPGTCSGARP